MTNTTFALNYLAPVSLCCNYSSLSLSLSLSLCLSLSLTFYPSRCIRCCSRKKDVLIFEALIHQHVKKKKKMVVMKFVENWTVKHPFLSPFFNYIYRFSRCAKDHSPREVHVHFTYVKESMPNKFWTCVEMCTCDHMPHMMKP